MMSTALMSLGCMHTQQTRRTQPSRPAQVYRYWTSCTVPTCEHGSALLAYSVYL